VGAGTRARTAGRGRPHQKPMTAPQAAAHSGAARSPAAHVARQNTLDLPSRALSCVAPQSPPPPPGQGSTQVLHAGQGARSTPRVAKLPSPPRNHSPQAGPCKRRLQPIQLPASPPPSPIPRHTRATSARHAHPTSAAAAACCPRRRSLLPSPPSRPPRHLRRAASAHPTSRPQPAPAQQPPQRAAAHSIAAAGRGAMSATLHMLPAAYLSRTAAYWKSVEQASACSLARGARAATSCARRLV